MQDLSFFKSAQKAPAYGSADGKMFNEMDIDAIAAKWDAYLADIGEVAPDLWEGKYQ